MSWCQGADHWIAVLPACLSWEPLLLESPPLPIWLELAKGGTEREAVSVSPQVIHRRDDRLMASAGRPPRSGAPRLCTAAHSSPQPTARFLATGLQRRELLRAAASQKIFTLYSSRSHGGSRKWSDIQLSFPDCPPSPVLHDERFVTRLSLWDFSSSHCCVSVINSLSPNAHDLNRTKIYENRTSQAAQPLKKFFWTGLLLMNSSFPTPDVFPCRRTPPVKPPGLSPTYSYTTGWWAWGKEVALHTLPLLPTLGSEPTCRKPKVSLL